MNVYSKIALSLLLFLLAMSTYNTTRVHPVYSPITWQCSLLASLSILSNGLKVNGEHCLSMNKTQSGCHSCHRTCLRCPVSSPRLFIRRISQLGARPKDTLATFFPVKTVRANNIVEEVHTVKIASFFFLSTVSFTLTVQHQLPCCSSPQVISVSRHRRWTASRRSLEHRVHGYSKWPAPTARTAITHSPGCLSPCVARCSDSPHHRCHPHPLSMKQDVKRKQLSPANTTPHDK